MTMPATSAALDRALTIGGIGRSSSGELSEVTRGIYAHWYGRAAEWKRSELGTSSRTFTPEQVAQYAAWLVEQGYARSTAGLAVRAIRWFHRVAGEPVPDGLPASYVLRSGDSTAADHDGVNGLDDPASRDPLDLLAAMTAVCRPRDVKGCRDLLIVTLAFYAGVGAERISALNLGDVEPAGRAWRVTSGSGEAEIEHLAEPGHYVTMCGACAIERWLDALSTHGVDVEADNDRPLLRAVDKAGNIAGTFDPYCGTASLL